MMCSTWRVPSEGKDEFDCRCGDAAYLIHQDFNTSVHASCDSIIQRPFESLLFLHGRIEEIRPVDVFGLIATKAKSVSDAWHP